MDKKEEIKILQHHTAPVFDINYSLKTNCFYTAGGDGNFAVCSLESFILIKNKKSCVLKKYAVIDFNYTTSEIAVACGDCNIYIFDLITSEEKKTFKAHELSSNIVSVIRPNEKLILTGGQDAHLKIWDAKSLSL